jgi:hypothetical protein
VNELRIPVYETELCYILIQLLGLSFGQQPAHDPLYQLCEKLVFEFEIKSLHQIYEEARGGGISLSALEAGIFQNEIPHSDSQSPAQQD